MKRNKYRTIQAARLLRKELTPAESLLWKFLNNRGMIKVKFRRQRPLSGFVVDFYCPKRRLAIEIDGEIHNGQKESDHIRQRLIENKGIRVLRFKNAEVLNSTDTVLQKIKKSIENEEVPSPRSGEGCRGED